MMTARWVVVAGIVGWLAGAAGAANIVVTTFADELNGDGDCSLREAVVAANTNAGVDACGAGTIALDTIMLPAGTYTLAVTGAGEDAAATGDLDLLGSTSIVGAMDGITAIVATGLGDRVLDVRTGLAVALDRLIIQGGDVSAFTGIDGTGGGIRGQGADLAIADCLVAENDAREGAGLYLQNGEVTVLRAGFFGNDAGAGGAGGVKLAQASGTFTDVTFRDNWTSSIGGGAWVFGTTGTSAEFNRCTFEGNVALNGAGGLSVSDVGYEATIRNSTFHMNVANIAAALWVQNAAALMSNVTMYDNEVLGSDAGGIYVDLAGVLLMRNSVLSGNVATNGPDCLGTVVSGGYNLIGDVSDCTITLETGDVVGMDPVLGMLGDNDGLTETLLPQTGSPLIDAGNPDPPGTTEDACEPEDQRGFTRDGACDIGSVEVTTTTTTVTTTTVTTTTVTTTTTSTTSTIAPTSTTTTTTATTTTQVSTTSTPATTSSTVAPTTSTTGTPSSTTPPTTVPPPLCVQPARIEPLSVKIGGLGAPAGNESVVLSGTLDLPATLPAVLSPSTDGLQLFVGEPGNPPIFDLTRRALPIPPGGPGTGCGPRDGWNGLVYKNGSGALPPGCAAGSARGLRTVKLKDRRAKGKGLIVRVQAKRMSLPTPRGPLDVVIVPGTSPTAGQDGACGRRQFTAAECRGVAKSFVCK